MPGTVTVACKMPNGLILRNFTMEDSDEPIAGGGFRTKKRAVQKGDPVTLKGNATAYGETAKHPIIGGYGLTHGVDKDFFDEWLKANADSHLVKNHIVFAHEKQEMASGAAKEKAALKSGLEPIDRNKLPKGIETANRAA